MNGDLAVVYRQGCQEPGCDRRHIARGYCTLHYQRRKVSGTLPPRPTLLDQFWSSVDKSGECWTWTGPRDDHGYGRASKRLTGTGLAHRVACELAFGPGGDLVAMHECDNPPCVRTGPGHVRWGTQNENLMDAVTKGRMVAPPVRRGEKGNGARLHESDVIDIRTLHALGATKQSLAAAFGVGRRNVSWIVNRNTWTDLP